MSNILAMWDGKRTPSRGDEPPPPGGDLPEARDPWSWAPFEPLGKSAGVFWFFDSGGELVSLSARALGQYPDLLTLTGGKLDWLLAHWPAFDKEGNANGWFTVRGVCVAIIERSADMPAFDPTEPRRRYGLWPVPGGAALHLGRQVIWCGAPRPAGFREAGALWPAMGPRPAPAAPASMQTGKALEAMLGRWNWAHADAPAVMLGLLVCGMLGGLVGWRAHGFVVGEQGTGKTTLLRFIASLCPLTRYLNDFTEAGVRQLLSETAAGVILDEAEGDGHGDSKLQKVIEMLRRASSGDGAQGVKGTAEQVSKSFTVTASAIMGAILPPPLSPQDAARFTVLQLRPLEAQGDPDEMTRFAAEHGRALWGRVVEAAGRIAGLFRLLRARLIERGYSPRVADQLGVIAAGRWALVEDHDPPPGETELIDDPLECIAWLLISDAEQATDSGGNQALQRLLASPLEMAGDKLVVGQVLARLRRLGREMQGLEVLRPDWSPEAAQSEFDKLERLLGGHGIRWGTLPLRREPGAPAPPGGVYVAVGSHPRLLRAYDGTPWAGQRWGAAMAQLPGALGGRASPPVTIAGGKWRSVWLPLTTLDGLTRDE